MLLESMPAWIRAKANPQDPCLEKDSRTRILIIQMIKHLIGRQEELQEPVVVFWIQV